MRSGTAFRRQPSAPPTSAIASSSSLLPTPSAAVYGYNQGGESAGGPIRYSLTSMAQRGMLPTPTAGDAKASGTAGNWTAESGRHSGTTLTDALVRGYLPTPTARDWRVGGDARERSNGAMLIDAVAAPAEIVERELRLNPVFVERMMGWPDGWTRTLGAETRGSTASRPPSRASTTRPSAPSRAIASSSSATESCLKQLPLPGMSLPEG